MSSLAFHRIVAVRPQSTDYNLLSTCTIYNQLSGISLMSFHLHDCKSSTIGTFTWWTFSETFSTEKVPQEVNALSHKMDTRTQRIRPTHVRSITSQTFVDTGKLSLSSPLSPVRAGSLVLEQHRTSLLATAQRSRHLTNMCRGRLQALRHRLRKY